MTTQDFEVERDGWSKGDLVEWRVNPEMVGMVVHNPEEDPNIVMVEALERDGMDLLKTGHTLTASPSDIDRFSGQATVKSDGKMETENSFDVDVEAEFNFSADFGTPEASVLSDGFNEYGVRENRDENGELESVDVMYRAMEPGPPEKREGVRITPEFLRTVASKNYQDPPFMMDHSKGTSKKLGHIRKVSFQNGGLYVLNRIPNTGSSTKEDAIADFTHEPPAIRDGSVGFGMSYEVEVNDDGEPEFTDAKVQEFSSTPFPGGYENGGVQATAAFSEAVESNLATDEELEESSEAGSAVRFTREINSMEFSTVEPTGDVEEMGEDELREVVTEYREAQEQNESVFEDLSEDSEESSYSEEDIEELQEFKESRAESIADNSPLRKEEVVDYGVSRLDELYQEFVAGTDETDEVEETQDENDEAEFTDMGSEGETHDPDGEAEFSEEAENAVDGISGLSV
jgi:hypothetical protein